MEAFNQYHANDDIIRSIATLFVLGALALFLLFVFDIPSMLESTGESLTPDTWVLPILIWRLICFSVCVSALVYTLRMKNGHLVVRSHAQKVDEVVHPVGVENLVTFSSWTLVLSIFYFLFAIFASVQMWSDSTPSTSLDVLVSGFFVVALGASFLTSTVVRFVILPENHKDEEHHRRQFWFHNQVMHNFCTLFLVAEILFTTPQLEFSYMLFGILTGLSYALFAFPFAMFGGGYYVYSFIDPRLQQAPLFISVLAFAISFAYIGVWIVSAMISLNYALGAIVLMVWSSSIVQFAPLIRIRGGRAEPKTEAIGR